MSKAKMDPRPLPKRFYAAANCVPHEAGFVLTLDGKMLRTPQQKLLYCASQQLMQKIAEEWNVQKEFIDTDAMPLTRLLNIALDRVPLDREALLADIANYCETDLLFYRAPTESVIPGLSRDPLQDVAGDPGIRRDDGIPNAADELAALQLQHFTPILDWAKAHHGLHFVLTEGVMPVAQPDASLQKLNALFAAAQEHELAALAMKVPLLGSALLALAIWHGALSVEDALIAARLDETVQAKHWGEDPETMAKWNAKCRDIRAAAFFLTGKPL